jgi:hypothetical protein
VDEEITGSDHLASEDSNTHYLAESNCHDFCSFINTNAEANTFSECRANKTGCTTLGETFPRPDTTRDATLGVAVKTRDSAAHRPPHSRSEQLADFCAHDFADV